MATAVTQAGGEIIRLPMASKNPVTMFANARRLAKLVTDHKVTLVHARSRAPAWSAFLAARWTGRPFVTTYHGSYSSRAPLKMFYSGVMAGATESSPIRAIRPGSSPRGITCRWNAQGWSIKASTSHALPPARSRRTPRCASSFMGRQGKAGRSFCMQPG
jgi:hypothetical protein